MLNLLLGPKYLLELAFHPGIVERLADDGGRNRLAPAGLRLAF